MVFKKKKKIKTVNYKMATNTYVSRIDLKNKLCKQEAQRQNHGYGKHFDGCPMGEGCGGMEEEVRELRSTNR